MNACSTYIISLSGPSFDVMDIIAFLAEHIDDQNCFDGFSLKINSATTKMMTTMILRCFNGKSILKSMKLTLIFGWKISRIWPKKWSKYLPLFSIAGHIEDSENGDLMDLNIQHTGKKLTPRSSCWYIYIHMINSY